MKISRSRILFVTVALLGSYGVLKAVPVGPGKTVGLSAVTSRPSYRPGIRPIPGRPVTRPIKKFKHVEEKKEDINAAVTSVGKATGFARNFFLKSHLPNFRENYKLLKDACGKAKDVPRIDMPVISEIKDIKRFQEDMSKGHVDIFKPHALSDLFKDEEGKHIQFPTDLKEDERGKTWLTLGTQDGDPDDDKINATIEYVAASELIPTQSQIWLKKLLGGIFKFGAPKEGSRGLEATIIISKEGYILDGHHRYGRVMLADPSLKMRVLKVPLDIDTLLKMGRSYGNAIGNEQKA